MGQEYVPFLKEVAVKQPLMWVVDVETGVILDMTPATSEFFDSLDVKAYPSSVTEKVHREASQSVVATGESRTLIEWVKTNGSWHKLARTKSHAGGNCVLEISQDITSFDPRSKWLARINLVDQRLEMGNGESISFDEFVVLHMLLKGFKHKRIAETLNISPKTVEYRISRMKNALKVESTEDMMLEVSSSGMIYLAMIPIDLDDPAQTELELYKKVPD
jgi:DNA-binding CsgD family transcriptional regulator